MVLDCINPAGDPRISHCNASLNGKNYHYLLAAPPRGYRATIFLIHGWPDISLGWRYQIPPLLQAGYRVVCPDIMGFGGTDAPPVSPPPSNEGIEYYSFKRAAEDIKELARQLGTEQIILGGHDWGGAVVYKVALYHPSLVTHLFSICTPYTAPRSTYIPLQTMIKILPNFTYQLQLASGAVESHVKTKAQIKQFLNGMYGGTGPNGEKAFDVRKGVFFENLGVLRKTPLLGEEELEVYAEEFSRNGMSGGVCWYRNREVNFQDELQLTKKTIDIPVLFVQATKDEALPPAMSEGMEEYVPNMTRKSVATSHWALWEAPEQVNGMIKEWLEKVDQPKSSL
ncbi:hypothetical protein N7G274_001131 [Stereocaulon virgatum]|uniref:AB hydrolase-1 domain-containing protein n=1 Tax=Stereocaulon virgatum TaxID=373712 RepID=A0ABR4AMZ3_9LECA